MMSDLHRVMHGIAIKKHAAPAAIAALAGVSVETAGAPLAAAEASGRVVAADGKYLLSPAGQIYDELRRDQDFVAAYERFEIINNDLKSLITDWQTMDIGGQKVPNDHSNADYDDRIIGRLGDLHERFEPVLGVMVAREPRLQWYAERLTEALEKAEDGDVAWVSDATIESYHTVWFEMHEDLLRLLGRERTE